MNPSVLTLGHAILILYSALLVPCTLVYVASRVLKDRRDCLARKAGQQFPGTLDKFLFLATSPAPWRLTRLESQLRPNWGPGPSSGLILNQTRFSRIGSTSKQRGGEILAEGILKPLKQLAGLWVLDTCLAAAVPGAVKTSPQTVPGK